MDMDMDRDMDRDMELIRKNEIDLLEYDAMKINPATGLSGDGFIDSAGNPWYTSMESDFSNECFSESTNSCDELNDSFSDSFNSSDDLLKDINDEF